MNNLEDAYGILAAALLEFAGDDGWLIAGSKTTVLQQMTQTSYWRGEGGRHIENDRFPCADAAWLASDAALYIRDQMMNSEATRIWGFALVLYPTGKFNIEFDYTKPAD